MVKAAFVLAVCGILTFGLPSPLWPDTGSAEEYSVEDALELGRRNASELSIKRLEVLKAGAELREARARSGPTVSLQSSGSLLSNPTEGIKIEKGSFGYSPTAQSAAPVALPDQDLILLEDGEHTYFRVSATLSQPLYTFGKIKNAVQAAVLGLSVAEREYESKVADVERQVLSAYFGAVFSESMAGLLAEAEQTASDIVTDRDLAFNEGIITRAELLEAISRNANLTSQRAAIDEATRSARAALSVLTGVDFSTALLSTGYRKTLPEIDEKSLLNGSLGSNPDRAALLHRLAQAETLISIEEGGRLFLPDVSLNVSLDITGQKVPVLEANWRESWDANLVITVGTALTMFDSGASKSKIEQAEYTADLARKGLEAFDQGLELRIRQAVETARAGWQEIARAEADMALAAEQLKNAQISFENELITRAELLAARLGAFAAEAEYERVCFVYETALIEIESTTGTVLLPRGLE